MKAIVSQCHLHPFKKYTNSRFIFSNLSKQNITCQFKMGNEIWDIQWIGRFQWIMNFHFAYFSNIWANFMKLTQAGYCVLTSKVGLGSVLKNTDINGLHKIWTRNHTAVDHLFSNNNLHQSQKNDALLRLWLSTSTRNKETLFYSQ